MKCLVCGGKMRHRGHTAYTYTSEDGETFNVIITDVPAEVCGQCGERVYVPEVTGQLLQIIERTQEGKPAKRTVEVPLYSLGESRLALDRGNNTFAYPNYRGSFGCMIHNG